VRWRFALLLFALPTIATAEQQPHHKGADRPQVLAPGYSALTFPAPAAGSYALPALGAAADGVLLDSSGAPASLHALYSDRTVVLSFIYTSCPDVNGCPLATFVLSQVQQRLSSHAGLADKVRLISVSFDPVNDSPAVMADYGTSFRRHDVDWRFLTSESDERLAPILDDYDQLVIRDFGPDGEPIGTMSHILRVFLIDQNKKIRNIYSPSFLHPDILLADILTVTSDDVPID
jgi:cytochrome oxidase Cu insertion factor (SCO1/SenC/PrrC family)